MKKLFLITALFISTHTFADELPNYDAIKTAVLSGKTIHITVNFAKCQTPKQSQNLTNVGIFTPNEIMLLSDEMATSFNHFTMNNPAFPNRAVNEFATYRITSDNTLNLTYQLIDPQNYTILGDKMEVQCALGKGAKVFG